MNLNHFFAGFLKLEIHVCKNEPMKCILVIPFSQDTSLYNACLVKINNEFGFNFGDINDVLDCNMYILHCISWFF